MSDRGMSPREIERWPSTPSTVEVRNRNGGMYIGGLAATYNSRSHDLGGYVEEIEPGAFSKSAGDQFPNVTCRYEHRDLLGTTAAGTLQLVDARNGLDYTCLLPESRADIYELTQRGDLRHSSFSFQAYQQFWDYKESTPVRHLQSVRLIDVAPVANPAYPNGPNVGLRSLAMQMDADPAEVEALAAQGELRRLFVRSDPHYRPFARNGRQALLELMLVKHPLTRNPKALDAYRTRKRLDATAQARANGLSDARTSAQARAELTRTRYPATPLTMPQRRKQLTDMAKPPIVGDES